MIRILQALWAVFAVIYLLLFAAMRDFIQALYNRVDVVELDNPTVILYRQNVTITLDNPHIILHLDENAVIITDGN